VNTTSSPPHAVPTTPLVDHGPLPGELVLRDGTRAFVWPLLPTDAETLRDGFRRLSADSRRRRFLTSLAALNDATIRLLVAGVDGVHHVALILVAVPAGGIERPVGVARLVLDPADPTTADVAFTVADEWQGRGVGNVLATALMVRDRLPFGDSRPPSPPTTTHPWRCSPSSAAYRCRRRAPGWWM